MIVESIAPPTTCDGRSSGVVASAWGFETLPCQQNRGLTRYTDQGGIERAYCRHHRHYVLTRWPRAEVAVPEAVGEEDAVRNTEDDDCGLRLAPALFDILTLGRITVDRPARHITVAGCGLCKPGMRPPHDASERCESGRRSHCSCDTCF